MSKPHNPFRYFNSSPEVIRLAVMMYVRFPLSLRNVEALGVDEVTIRRKIRESAFLRALLEEAVQKDKKSKKRQKSGR